MEYFSICNMVDDYSFCLQAGLKRAKEVSGLCLVHRGVTPLHTIGSLREMLGVKPLQVNESLGLADGIHIVSG